MTAHLGRGGLAGKGHSFLASGARWGILPTDVSTSLSPRTPSLEGLALARGPDGSVCVRTGASRLQPGEGISHPSPKSCAG